MKKINYSEANQYHEYYHDNEEKLSEYLYDTIYEFYGETTFECQFEDHMTERFNDHMEKFGIYFIGDDYERFTWFIEDYKLTDNKKSRELFITYETQQGHDYGYEADNETPLW